MVSDPAVVRYAGLLLRIRNTLQSMGSPGMAVPRRPPQNAKFATRMALAISVNVTFFAGRNGNVEPSTRKRFSKSWLSQVTEVVNGVGVLLIGSVPA